MAFSLDEIQMFEDLHKTDVLGLIKQHYKCTQKQAKSILNQIQQYNLERLKLKLFFSVDGRKKDNKHILKKKLYKNHFHFKPELKLILKELKLEEEECIQDIVNGIWE